MDVLCEFGLFIRSFLAFPDFLLVAQNKMMKTFFVIIKKQTKRGLSQNFEERKVNTRYKLLLPFDTLRRQKHLFICGTVTHVSLSLARHDLGMLTTTRARTTTLTNIKRLAARVFSFRGLERKQHCV